MEKNKNNMEENQEKSAIDPREIENLYRAFENADYVISKRYRYSLGNHPVCVIPSSIDRIPIGDNFQIFQISKLVYDKNENTLDKLITAYHAVSAYKNAGVITLIISDGKTVELYQGTVCREFNSDGTCNVGERSKQCETLIYTLRSNFPGGDFSDKAGKNADGKDINFDRPKLIEKAIPDKSIISAVTGVAAFRDQDDHENDSFIQGLEKLIDGMHGVPFSAIFIADCISKAEIESMCADYEDIYSQLYPFLQTQQTVGQSSAVSDTESFMKGVTDTTNESISKSNSHGVTKGKFKSDTVGGSVGGSVGGNAGVSVGPINAGVNSSVNFSMNYNHTWGKSENISDTVTTSETTGSSKSLSEQNSVAKAITSTDNDGIQITYQNRGVKSLLDRIDEQIKRLRSCEDYGIYDFGAYFIAGDVQNSTKAASIYSSLMRGENSSVEASSINTWNVYDSKRVSEYLKRMYHPQIAIPNFVEPVSVDEDKENTNSEAARYKIQSVTPTTLISGKELAIQMNYPKKSVNGVAVLECTEFGREALSTSGKSVKGLSIGKVSHMRKTTDITLEIDRNNLTAHTFITGSTGSGKSNTVYTILHKLCLNRNNDVKFLVVEPAKGEYKDVLGGYNNVHVYGTNPKKSDLLKLNPFSFPDDIHVLEHIDRLVELFNACWPMYAAMPAVLKDAIEASYVNCGWSLTRSECHPKHYPTFDTVMQSLPNIINSSAYSSDTKGDYIGALLTRIKSLTNGINGQIFCSDEEIDDKELFDKNVIVDISRVGSMETKSLLMGIMVMKLQEYRMSVGGINQNLRHVTVLEEAHNLLRRTSFEQSQESSNLQGKSVEMLANAIAEMRTYGEGFIIADQSPGLMDMSVIRNTNTKIIMRLPDESDRMLVGKAAGLNDEQIVELAKLGQGVAAVYQNDWLEPVLCQIDHFSGDKQKPYCYSGSKYIISESKEKLFSYIVGGTNDRNELSDEEADSLRKWVDRLDTGNEAKDILTDAINGKLSRENTEYMLYCLVKGRSLIGEQTEKSTSPTHIQSIVDTQISDMLNISMHLASEIRKLIFIYAAKSVENDIKYHNDLLYYGGIM